MATKVVRPIRRMRLPSLCRRAESTPSIDVPLIMPMAVTHTSDMFKLLGSWPCVEGPL